MTDKQEKWTILQGKDYSTSQSLREWIETAQEFVNENTQLLTALETKREQDNKNLNGLHKDLLEGQGDKAALEKQIFELKQELEQETILIDKYVKESSFVKQELTTLQNLDFLKERKGLAEDNEDQSELTIISELEQTISEVEPIINLLQEELRNYSTTNPLLRRTSVLLGQEEHKSTLPSSPAITPLFSSFPQEVTTDTSLFSSKEKNLYSLLELIKKKWNDHLSGVKKSEFYQGQEEIIYDLLTYLGNNPGDNLYQWTEELVTKWTTAYPEWIDACGDLFWIKHFLDTWDDVEDSSENLEEEAGGELKDKIVELEIEKKNLEAGLRKAKEATERKNREWLKLVAQSSKDLDGAVNAEKKKYRTFINPNNPEQVITAAKAYHMSTEEEVEAKVNEALVPLQVWENTFEGKSAEEVKKLQEKLQAEKRELSRQKEELIRGKAKLAEERRKFFSDLKDMESQLKNIQEEREAFEAEKETYLSGFSQARDEATKLRNEVARLTEIIFKLGGNPDEGKEENFLEEENNDSNVPSENDNEEEINSPLHSEHSSHHDESEEEEQKNAEQVTGSEDELKSEIEEEFNEDELSDEGKEILEKIKRFQETLKIRQEKMKELTSEEETVSNQQYIRQLQSSIVDIERDIAKNQTKLRELIAQANEQKNAQIETK